MLSMSTLELAFRTPPRVARVTTLLALIGTTAAGAACSPTPGHLSFAARPAPMRLEATNTPPQRIKVELREWKIALATDSVASGPVTLQVHNAGTIAHAFEIEGNGTEKRTAPIPADSSATLSVTLKPGHYQIYCPLAGGAHKKMGMVADLAVHSTM
jgi:uncharacterized cupredoxin-like copper-binding protein